jgi:hypothetical protein
VRQSRQKIIFTISCQNKKYDYFCHPKQTRMGLKRFKD